MGIEVFEAHLGNLRTKEVIQHHVAVLAEFRKRGLIRSGDSLGPGLAEVLTREAYGGTLAPRKNEPGWDVLLRGGEERVQVKSRTAHDDRKSGRGIGFKSWEFDRCVIVLFEHDYSVMEAVEVSMTSLSNHGTRTAPYRLSVRRGLTSVRRLEGAEDVASKLREAMARL